MPASGKTVELTNQVRRRRVAAGLSQLALAQRCRVTRQAIHAIERGQYVPNTAVALRLARALGCPVEALFTWQEAPAQLQAEWLGPAATGLDRSPRVRVARVGDRVFAYPLSGSAAIGAAADGLVTEERRPMQVELLIDPDQVDGAVVIQGCDPALALLGAHLTRSQSKWRVLWVERSSLAALRALGRGEAHIAGTHLRDPQTGESNLPYIRQELHGRDLVVVTFADWQQGLIVASGNPKRITAPRDLGRPDVTVINREFGSGSRMLLDAWLSDAKAPPDEVRGYRHEVRSHQDVAEAVALGAADVGPGIMAVARARDLDFVPLQTERYDLVIPRANLTTPVVQALLEVAVSGPFRRELAALGGYDSSHAGTIVAELAASDVRAPAAAL